MQDQTTRAGHLTAIAQGGAPTALPFTLAGLTWHADTLAGEAVCRIGERAMKPRRRARLARFARTAAHHPVSTGRTCVHAAKLLPTVRRALPWYVLPIVALATIVKCFPLDFGTDEALFCVAFLLVLWQRPGLLEALYREAQAGKPAPCWCPKHAGHTHGNVIFARKAVAR